MNRFPRLLSIVVLSPIMLTGCLNLERFDDTIIEKNRELADKAHEEVGEAVEEGTEYLKEYTKEQIAGIVADLTEEAKKDITQWVIDQGLNQYGDASDTVYAGGTPLFNEGTNEVINRYQYILEKNPQIIEILNLE